MTLRSEKGHFRRFCSEIRTDKQLIIGVLAGVILISYLIEDVISDRVCEIQAVAGTAQADRRFILPCPRK